ncbi:MAG: ribosome biogenesis GTPase Der [bacterium]|nr:ribosome biogenesis GTPase Der [Deltaproteobacteria bacterium]MCP4908183.1 ribosome biogenesis GTPase Der [bacterium]
MTDSQRLPVVALVGRPNVGKSTLFNRYAGYRRALVADQPGLTRDRIAERIEIEGRMIWIVDTAGLDPVRGEGLDAAVQAQARSAVENADAILFIVDGKLGLSPEDEAIATTLRRSGKPLGLLVNKIDQPMHHRDRIHDFYRLGIDETFAVSAEHGGGTFDALERVLEKLPEAELDPEAEAVGTRIAIVGRPNVGKSSIANRLAREDRVVVSDAPGTTRDAVDIQVRREGEDYVLVDTAGLRKIAKRRGPGEHGGALMTLRSLERADIALLIVDAAEGIADQDARVAALMREQGCSALVLANKWDLVETDDRPDVLADIGHGLRFMSDVPILPVSALSGAGLNPLFKKLKKVVAAGEQRISTSDLNRWLQDVAEKHPPSMASRGALRRPNKLFYASQVAVRPPTIVVFCSEPKAIQTSYVRFLENQLRESFGFAGTPVRVLLRQRSGRRRDERDE